MVIYRTWIRYLQTKTKSIDSSVGEKFYWNRDTWKNFKHWNIRADAESGMGIDDVETRERFSGDT